MARDKKLEKKIAEQPCRACGKEPAGDCHHILTRAARPDLIADPRNLLPLCRKHHTEIHNIGTTYFADKYALFGEFRDRGFYQDCFNKWRLDNDKRCEDRDCVSK